MKTALMAIQLIVSILMIATCLMYETKENVTNDSGTKETSKNAILSKGIKIFAVLFFLGAILQLII